MEVVSDSGEDGIDAVALASLEIISIHPMLGLQMADNGLDSGSSLHFTFDGSGCAADLASDPDAVLVGMIVAAIALIDVDTLGLDAGQLLKIGDNRPQGVPIEGVSLQRFGVKDELASFG